VSHAVTMRGPAARRNANWGLYARRNPKRITSGTVSGRSFGGGGLGTGCPASANRRRNSAMTPGGA
jgi:hypothetical protein